MLCCARGEGQYATGPGEGAFECDVAKEGWPGATSQEESHLQRLDLCVAHSAKGE